MEGTPGTGGTHLHDRVADRRLGIRGVLVDQTLNAFEALSPSDEAELTLPLDAHKDLDQVRTSDEPPDRLPHQSCRRKEQLTSRIAVGAAGLEPATSAL